MLLPLPRTLNFPTGRHEDDVEVQHGVQVLFCCIHACMYIMCVYIYIYIHTYAYMYVYMYMVLFMLCKIMVSNTSIIMVLYDVVLSLYCTVCHYCCVLLCLVITYISSLYALYLCLDVCFCAYIGMYYMCIICCVYIIVCACFCMYYMCIIIVCFVCIIRV